jgi:hypothetical protein
MVDKYLKLFRKTVTAIPVIYPGMCALYTSRNIDEKLMISTGI